MFTAFFMDGRKPFRLPEPLFTIKAFKFEQSPWYIEDRPDCEVSREIIFYRLVLPIRQGDDIVAGMYKLEKDHKPMDITQLIKVAGSDAEAAGWRSDRPEPHNYATPEVYRAALNDWYGNKLMLMVGEINEGHDELRNGKGVREIYYPEVPLPASLVYEAGAEKARELINEYNKDKPKKPEGLPTELADAVIRIADFCESEGIDLEAAIQLKLAYNRSRGFKHGGKQF
jgi:hypothetical protein